jgi:serine phosphatase RsbU (regulator of sigma subunit)
MTTEKGFLRAAPPSAWSAQADLLARVAKVLALEVELERLLPQIVGFATEVLAADRSSLFLYDRERDELWGTVAQGLGEREIRFPARHGLAGAVLERGYPLVVANAYADPRFDRRWDEETGYRTRSVLVAPILDRAGDVLGVLQVLNKRGGAAFTPTDVVLLEAFASHVAVALERAMLAEAYADRQRMQAALQMARDAQRALLPEAPLASEAIDIAAYLAPAYEVGGDLYDYFDIDAHRLGFAVGDVAGKGMAAGLQMASVQALLRGYGRQGLPPAQCLDLINETQRGSAATFTSIVYGVLDTRTGRVDYCNAGHMPPILLRASGSPTTQDRAGQLPLSPLQRTYSAQSCVLEPSDTLVLYTDGVVEAVARDREPFGERRLLDALRGGAGETAEAVVHRVLAALEAFAGLGERRDDLTVLALRYRP